MSQNDLVNFKHFAAIITRVELWVWQFADIMHLRVKKVVRCFLQSLANHFWVYCGLGLIYEGNPNGKTLVFADCPLYPTLSTAQRMKFSIKKFFSKCDYIIIKLRIWSNILKKSIVEKISIFVQWRRPRSLYQKYYQEKSSDRLNITKWAR